MLVNTRLCILNSSNSKPQQEKLIRGLKERKYVLSSQPFPYWRRVRVVEGARLESVYTGNRIASSNLAVSALRRFCKEPPFLFLLEHISEYAIIEKNNLSPS